VVHLKDFSLLSLTIQSSDLLKAIELAIPTTAIEEASLPKGGASLTLQARPTKKEIGRYQHN